MDKVTQILVIITAACLVLSACAVEPPVITPVVHEKPASPSVGSTQEKGLVNPPTINGATISPTKGVTQVKALVITQDMNGKTVSLQVGDTFEIHLATIPVVGFEWTAKNLDTAILLQEGNPVYQAGSASNTVGGIVTLRFKVVGAGKTHLTLLYLHPAENGVPSLYNKSFGVNFEVK
jgi:predicted secreted protein